MTQWVACTLKHLGVKGEQQHMPAHCNTAEFLPIFSWFCIFIHIQHCTYVGVRQSFYVHEIPYTSPFMHFPSHPLHPLPSLPTLSIPSPPFPPSPSPPLLPTLSIPSPLFLPSPSPPLSSPLLPTGLLHPCMDCYKQCKQWKRRENILAAVITPLALTCFLATSVCALGTTSGVGLFASEQPTAFRGRRLLESSGQDEEPVVDVDVSAGGQTRGVCVPLPPFPTPYPTAHPHFPSLFQMTPLLLSHTFSFLSSLLPSLIPHPTCPSPLTSSTPLPILIIQSWQSVVGYVIGCLSGFLYLISRIPQIIKNVSEMNYVHAYVCVIWCRKCDRQCSGYVYVCMLHWLQPLPCSSYASEARRGT